MKSLTIQSVTETSWLAAMAAYTLAEFQQVQAICVRPPVQQPSYEYQKGGPPLLVIPWGINQEKGKQALYTELHLREENTCIIDIPHLPATAAIDLNTLGGWSSTVTLTHLIAVCPAWTFQLAVADKTALLLPANPPAPEADLAHLHLVLLQRAFSETHVETGINLFCRYLRQTLIPIIQIAQEALKGRN